MADDILDLIDHAIADHGWGMSDDAMRWAPDAGKAVVPKQQWADLEAALANFGEAIRFVIWPSLERVIRHVSTIVNQEPLRTLLAEHLRHQRRMAMWRRKTRTSWPRWTR